MSTDQLQSQDDSLDFKRYAVAAAHLWWLILLLAATGGVVAFFYSDRIEPVYEARAVLLVRYSGGTLLPTTGNFNQSNELASAYQRLVTASPFLQRVSEQEGFGMSSGALRSMVSARAFEDPPIVEIRAKHSDPDIAAATAQTVADEFTEFVIERRLTEIARIQNAAAIQGIESSESILTAQLSAIDTLSLLEPVRTPGGPISPRTRQTAILGGLASLVIAGLLVILLDIYQDAVKSTDQIGSRFGLTSLGVVPRWKNKGPGTEPLAMLDDPSGHVP